MSLITAENLCMGYGGTRAVDGVSFAVEAGEYLCIVGENGSGKTTLLRGLLGLMAPQSGRVVYGDGLLRTRIGYLPQQTAIQRDFPASVYEVVQSGCLNSLGNRLFFGASVRETVRKNLARMGLEALGAKSYRALSGGQQQRVLIARALCAADRVLLLDEPVAGLDPAHAQELYDLIGALNRDGMTVIMVSHDTGRCLRDATTVLQMGTRALFFGTAEAYRQTPYGKLYFGEGDAACSS